MTKEEVIKSGWLEQYAMGILPEEQRIELEGYFQKWPELKDYVVEMYDMLEELSRENMNSFTAENKSQILLQKGEVLPTPRSQRLTKESKLWKKFGLASCGVAFICLLFCTTMYQMKQQAEAKYEQAKAQLADISANCEEERLMIQSIQGKYDFMCHHDTKQVILSGTNLAPEAKVIIYYNPNLQNSYLNIVDLPIIPTDKNYQLWVDIKDELVNLGTIAPTKDLMEIPCLSGAQSFKVTLGKSLGDKQELYAEGTLTNPM